MKGFGKASIKKDSGLKRTGLIASPGTKAPIKFGGSSKKK